MASRLIRLLRLNLQVDPADFLDVLHRLQTLNESADPLPYQGESIVLGVTFHQLLDHLHAEVNR